MKLLLASREVVWGGGEVFLHELATELKRYGHAVAWRVHQNSELSSRITEDEVHSPYSPIPYKIVIANDFRSLWISLLLDGPFCRRIFVVHGGWQLSPVRARLIRFSATDVFCVNSDLVTQARALRIARSDLLRIGPVARREKATWAAKLKTDSSQIYFGTIARLDPIKRLDVFCRLVNLLGARGIVVCPKPTNDVQVQLLRMLHRFPNIEIHADGDAEHVWKDADIFLSTSLDESFGLAHIEALQRGVPVLTTARQGPQDFMKNELAAGLLESNVLSNSADVDSRIARIAQSWHQYQTDAADAVDSRGPSACVRQILDLL